DQTHFLPLLQRPADRLEHRVNGVAGLGLRHVRLVGDHTDQIVLVHRVSSLWNARPRWRTKTRPPFDDSAPKARKSGAFSPNEVANLLMSARFPPITRPARVPRVARGDAGCVQSGAARAGKVPLRSTRLPPASRVARRSRRS